MRPDLRSFTVTALSFALGLALCLTSGFGQEPTPKIFNPPAFVGSYGPDGRFRTVPSSASPVDTNRHAFPYLRRSLTEVPPWIDLHNKSEVVIEDVAPPRYARKVVHPRSVYLRLFESLVAAAYGHDVVLDLPTDLTTDSRGRVIVCDAGEPAVDVLNGTTTLHIRGGTGYRLERPVAVAVDGSDNIYVADAGTNLITIYDPDLHFLRNFGLYRDENMFQQLAGLAIDRKNSRLFVLDAGVDELVELDLGGRILRRIGGPRHLGAVQFSGARAVAISDSRVAVLDLFGGRIQLFDLALTPLTQFTARTGIQPNSTEKPGFTIGNGYIYISDSGRPGIRIFDEKGTLSGEFGRAGRRFDEFLGPAGLWVDLAGRLYVADRDNRRIQVFQTATDMGRNKIGAECDQPSAPVRPSHSARTCGVAPVRDKDGASVFAEN